MKQNTKGKNMPNDELKTDTSEVLTQKAGPLGFGCVSQGLRASSPWPTPLSRWTTLRGNCSRSRGFGTSWCGESLSWDTCECIFPLSLSHSHMTVEPRGAPVSHVPSEPLWLSRCVITSWFIWCRNNCFHTANTVNNAVLVQWCASRDRESGFCRLQWPCYLFPLLALCRLKCTSNEPAVTSAASLE